MHNALTGKHTVCTMTVDIEDWVRAFRETRRENITFRQKRSFKIIIGV